MQKTKKIISALVCILMVCALLPAMIACAEEDEFEYLIEGDHVKITAYYGDGKKIVIPDEYNGLPVTTIGVRFNKSMFPITDIIIGKNVTTLEDDAFYGQWFAKMFLPKSVTNLTAKSFSFAPGVGGSIYYEGSKEDWDALGLNWKFDDFYGKYRPIESSSIPVYYNCSLDDMYAVVEKEPEPEPEPEPDSGYCGIDRENAQWALADGVLSITGSGIVGEPEVFAAWPWHNRYYTTAIIENGITNIGDGQFGGYLCRIVIPDSVTVLYDGAFFRCYNLTQINIPLSVKEIKSGIFNGWGGIRDIYYAGSVADWAKIKIDNMIPGNINIHFNSTLPEDNTDYSTRVFVKLDALEMDGDTILGFDVPPMIIEGTTMLPVRQALEPLGAGFEWNDEAQTVTIEAQEKTIVLTIGSNTALVDGMAKTMSMPAMIIEGRTLIPIRFVAEEIGYTVNWDEETRTVDIK